jgi:hypothetical protein
MPIFSLINNDVVENVVLCESLEDANKYFSNYVIIEIEEGPGQPGIGWTYDGFTLHPPQEEPPITE